MTTSNLPGRRAGVLLHPTSLPGPGDHGDLGPDAYRFIDFLAAAGIGVWQVLPLGPTHSDRSPYQCLSVHAGDPELISIQPLLDHGWVTAQALHDSRSDALQQARDGFRQHADDGQRDAWRHFTEAEAGWLDTYALFIALRDAHGHQGWNDWPQPLRDRQADALQQAREQYAERIEQVRFEQFLFQQQWCDLRRYANQRGIRLFGDLPIFVAHDSADVWANPEQFLLDHNGHPNVVAGVPPDYFSATGQRWGNPLYDWPHMAKDDFAWWRDRLRSQLSLFDLVRIDHFRGFEAYWEIPGDADTAVDGRWVTGPGNALFEAISKDLGTPLPLVAEDLGVITDEVEALRDRWGLPGMKILQFAFDGNADNPYLPHNHRRLSVVYTGTHDNDTSLGWYNSLDAPTRNNLHEYLGRPGEAWPWPLLRSALASVACLAVLPMQDLLALGSEHRMNVPGVAEGNWGWRFQWDWLQPELAARVHDMVSRYGRLGNARCDR